MSQAQHHHEVMRELEELEWHEKSRRLINEIHEVAINRIRQMPETAQPVAATQTRTGAST
jgi:hypothetical protein